MFQFKFDYLKRQFQVAFEYGYKTITCKDYIEYKEKKGKDKIIVNRVDVDFSVKKAEKIGQIFKDMGIKATFFIRLHAPEYNPFSFENYRIIKDLMEAGQELGYHSEVIDQATIWNENPEKCLIRDIKIFENIFETKIYGTASHHGVAGMNNLSFWKDKKPSDFGLLYEAYDEEPNFNLFKESFYISDSEWIQWKCYKKGNLVRGDRRPPAEHVKDGHPLIYLLTHSDTYYSKHFYEY